MIDAIHTYDSPWRPGDRVYIDGNDDLKALVTAVLWRETMPQIEVQWWSERSLQTAWVDPEGNYIVDKHGP